MEREHPSISVITPAYNSAATINETIESVLSQTYSDWEMIIVDDCSTDQTRDLLLKAEARDSRIHTVFLKKNSGAAVARNTALDHAKGRYIAFLDSDDRWKPDKLEKQLRFMQEHHYAFTFTGYEYILPNGTALHKRVQAPEQVTYHDMLKNTIVGCLTVMVDRDRIGSFHMPNLRTRQDLATWLSFLKKGNIAHGLNENLAEYRVGQASISGNKWQAARKTWYVYRQVERLNLWQSVWYFIHYGVNAVLKRVI
ncbi:glycosyltransferase family 2 protein [Sporolactobacillus sp. THM7-4]|nr:glycosyltransferase family 2 protein [Sporolactobacillus sp. THM7-4]